MPQVPINDPRVINTGTAYPESNIQTTPVVPTPQATIGDQSSGLTEAQVLENLAKFYSKPDATIQPTRDSVRNAISSSADIITQNNTDKAIRTAASTIAGGEDTSQVSPFQKQILDMYKTREERAINQEESNLAVQKARYESSLSQLNFKNQDLAKQLSDRYDKQIQSATANAVALNPYSTAKGAMTAENFKGEITANFNEAASKLAYQAELERQALAANDMEAVAAIKQQTQKTLSDLDDRMLTIGQQMQSEARQVEQFKETRRGAAQDDFQTYINTLSGSEELQGEIDSYMATGKPTAGVSAVIKKGMEAGLSSNEALSIMKYQSDKVRTQQTTEEYRANQLMSSAERQTKAANLAAGMSTIQQKSQEMIASGILPGTLEYAKGLASATVNSQTGLAATETSGYATIANIGSQLVGLKESLDALSKDDDVKNILLNYTGASVQSLTNKDLALLAGKINAIASPIARVMFGEKGVMTEPDIKRVMSALPTTASTAEVRNALYKEILINAKNAAINKLSVDASTYRNTAGVAPYIEQFVNTIDSTLNSLKSQNTTKGKRSYTDPKTGKTYTY